MLSLPHSLAHEHSSLGGEVLRTRSLAGWSGAWPAKAVDEHAVAAAFEKARTGTEVEITGNDK
jgi:hypothetical protein